MAVKNLVSGTLAGDITTSTTNILVHIADNISAQGILDFFPNPPFYITIMPKSPAVGVANRLDSEILQVTAVGNGQVGNAALTCVRGQRDTTAKAFSAGDIVTVGVYVEDVASFTEYSTTEKVVGTWVNGKPLYRKVINIGALPNATIKYVAHGLSNFRVRNFYGTAINPSKNVTFYLPTLSGNTSAFITMYVDATYIAIDTMSADRSGFTECYITLEYTKTTD